MTRISSTDVTILVVVRIGTGKVVLVGSDNMHKGGQRSHTEMPRMGGQTEIRPVGQRWFLLELVSAIQFIGFC